MPFFNNEVQCETPLSPERPFLGGDLEFYRGDDGVSPTIEVTDIAGGHRVTITDKDGEHVFDVADGANGVSPTVEVEEIEGGHRVTITDADGEHIFEVTDGIDGQNGEDGFSPTVEVEEIEGGHRVTITDADGEHVFEVADGEDGDNSWGSITGTLADQTDLKAALDAKQSVISDLETIRSGAELGLTALQFVPPTFRTAAAQDLIDAGKADVDDVPTKVSDLTNDSGFLTDAPSDNKQYARKNGAWAEVVGGGGTSDHTQLENRDAANQHPISSITGLQTALDGKQAAGDYATSGELDALADIVDGKADAADIPSLDGYATENWVESKGYLTQHQSLDGYATETYVNNHHDSTKQDTISDLASIRSGAELGATAVQPSDLTDYALKSDLQELQKTALTATVTIAVADWEGGTTVTKNVTGVTATNIVFCDSSDPDVQCTAQGAGTLTFTASATPSAEVTVKVVILP